MFVVSVVFVVFVMSTSSPCIWGFDYSFIKCNFQCTTPSPIEHPSGQIFILAISQVDFLSVVLLVCFKEIELVKL